MGIGRLEGMERCIDETKSGFDIALSQAHCHGKLQKTQWGSDRKLWKSKIEGFGNRRSKKIQGFGNALSELGSNGGADIAASKKNTRKERPENPINILINFLIIEKERYQPSTDYVS
ncbi:hypothetical protein TELCIR_00639 [Teladorsagia circumcincta]|uniref:Uncharacterized protein n=1 Tax=Teladorsagia circumcincta TaxID=45464 RepID=A0A2G9V445_TELCI|nr:hypothetical protein TELCIR_00639 [Teladorsagia circumcincta]